MFQFSEIRTVLVVNPSKIISYVTSQRATTKVTANIVCPYYYYSQNFLLSIFYQGWYQTLFFDSSMVTSKAFIHRDYRSRLRCRHRNHLVYWGIERTFGCLLFAFFLFAITGWGRCLSCVSTTKVNANLCHSISQWRKKQGLADEDNADENVKKRRRFLSIGRSFVGNKIPVDQLRTTRSRRDHNKRFDHVGSVSNIESRYALYSANDCRVSEVRKVNRKIPTPWPINLIQERLNNRRESSSQTTTDNKDTGALNDNGTSGISSYPSMGALFFAYAKQQARIGFRQVSEISSQIWYNLPPSAPPLLLLASIPRNIKILEGKKAVSAASGESFRRIIPIFSDPFARSIVLAGLGMAVVSWSNQELQRKRKLAPLALSALSDEDGVKGCGRVSRVFLPPFLPEVVPEPEIDALRGTTGEESNLGNAQGDERPKLGSCLLPVGAGRQVQTTRWGGLHASAVILFGFRGPRRAGATWTQGEIPTISRSISQTR